MVIPLLFATRIKFTFTYMRTSPSSFIRPFFVPYFLLYEVRFQIMTLVSDCRYLSIFVSVLNVACLFTIICYIASMTAMVAPFPSMAQTVHFCIIVISSGAYPNLIEIVKHTIHKSGSVFKVLCSASVPSQLESYPRFNWTLFRSIMSFFILSAFSVAFELFEE